MHSAEDLLHRLRACGAERLRAVRLKRNKRTLVSLSRDGRTLHVHVCFQPAPEAVVRALAAFANGKSAADMGGTASRDVLVEWTRTGGREAFQKAAAAKKSIDAVRCSGSAEQTDVVRSLYLELNECRFGGRLPKDLPLRLSSRMTSRLGHCRIGFDGNSRAVREIALNLDLLLPGNSDRMRETLAHEMAHAEAWLAHADRGHGAAWKRIARGIGIPARARSDEPIARRRTSPGR